MSDEEEHTDEEEVKPAPKKKPKLRGWVGRKAGAEEVAGSVDEKIAKTLEEQSDE